MKTDTKVWWEVSFRPSKAKLQELALVAIEHGLEFKERSALQLARHGDLFLMVRMSEEAAQALRDRLKLRADEVIYRSPTFFNHGSIRPIFGSPAEELESRKSRIDAQDVAS